MRFTGAVLTLMLLAGVAQAQPARQLPPRDRLQTEAPRGTAILRGTVVAADTGSPIRRAQVRVSAQGVANRLATTDAQGRFEVRDLPAGRYTLSGAKGGFVSLQYGQKRPSQSGTPIELGDGQTIDRLVIALPRGSVISGHITDEFGEPVANAIVSAMRHGFSGGARRVMAAPGANSRDTTDDQGHFRLFGLPPGDYLVSASFRSGGGEATDPAGDNTGYAATYYPGTTSFGEAQRVSVALGQEQSSVVFSLISTRLVRVTGAVLSSQGAPVTNGNVLLTPAGNRVALPIGNLAGRIDGSGQFRVLNVPPGRYVAQVRPGRGRGAAANLGEFGRQDITVGTQDLNGVVLVTAPGARILGSVVSDRDSTGTLRPQDVTITTHRDDFDPALPIANSAARVTDDWTFEIASVFEPRLFRARTAQGWTLKSVLLNGDDITDTPLDVSPGQTVSGLQVVLTDRQTEVNGRVSDARNNPITDVTVVVFPAEADKWTYLSRHIRAARPDQDGRFTIRGLPAYNDYVAVVVQGLEDGQAGDPEFLASVRDQGTTLSLKDGEARTLDLRFSPGR